MTDLLRSNLALLLTSPKYVLTISANSGVRTLNAKARPVDRPVKESGIGAFDTGTAKKVDSLKQGPIYDNNRSQKTRDADLIDMPTR
jgi:hypothetical protein